MRWCSLVPGYRSSRFDCRPENHRDRDRHEIVKKLRAGSLRVSGGTRRRRFERESIGLERSICHPLPIGVPAVRVRFVRTRTILPESTSGIQGSNAGSVPLSP
jgi:hypothetical protein